jgi:hypothetical protein
MKRSLAQRAGIALSLAAALLTIYLFLSVITPPLADLDARLSEQYCASPEGSLTLKCASMDACVERRTDHWPKQ